MQWQPHCAIRVVRTPAYLKAIMEVYGKAFTGLDPSEEKRSNSSLAVL